MYVMPYLALVLEYFVCLLKGIDNMHCPLAEAKICSCNGQYVI